LEDIQSFYLITLPPTNGNTNLLTPTIDFLPFFLFRAPLAAVYWSYDYSLKQAYVLYAVDRAR